MESVMSKIEKLVFLVGVAVALPAMAADVSYRTDVAPMMKIFCIAQDSMTRRQKLDETRGSTKAWNCFQAGKYCRKCPPDIRASLAG